MHSRPFPRRRRALPWLPWIAGGILVAWGVSFVAVLWWGAHNDAARADAIIVMGAAQYQGRPSPALRVRLDHAVALWRQGLSPLLLLTGGVGAGDTVSEAAAGRHYLLGLGVPDTAILLENEGRTSSESLRAATDLLRALRLRSAVVVSDPFHLLRLEILGRRLGFDLKTSPALPLSVALRHQWGSWLSESFKAPLALVADW